MSDAEAVIKSWPKWKQELLFPKPPKGHEWCKKCKGTGGVDVYEGCASVGYSCWVHCACSDCNGRGHIPIPPEDWVI